MKQRNPFFCVWDSIWTLGIYYIYWVFTLINDINYLAGEEPLTVVKALKVLLLTFVTCGIYFWYFVYQTGKKIYAAKEIRGIQASDHSVFYLIMSILFTQFVGFALMQNEVNDLIAVA